MSRSMPQEYLWDGLNALADEVVLCIFSHLSLEGLCRVSAVCRRWKRLADDNSLWNGLLYRAIPKGEESIFTIKLPLMLTGVSLQRVTCTKKSGNVMQSTTTTAKVGGTLISIEHLLEVSNIHTSFRLKAASLEKLIDLITPVGDEFGCELFPSNAAALGSHFRVSPLLSR